MSRVMKVLILEDNPNDADLMVLALEEGGVICQSTRVETARSFQASLENEAYDFLLVDYNMPSFDGLLALKMFLTRNLMVPFILVSGTVGEEIAIESLKAGATDYVLKSQLRRLAPAVTRALSEMKEVQRREQAEDALRFTGFAIDHAGDALFWVEASGELSYVNRAACSSLGYTREELLSFKMFNINKDCQNGEWSAWWLDMKTRGARSYESRHERKDGTTFPVEVVMNFLEFKSKDYLCVFARDISERKRLEQQIFQIQKMEAIGTLAGGIAHDFNNILTAMMGYTELIKYHASDEAKLQDHASQVITAGERAKALIRQILMFSRQDDSDRQPTALDRITIEVVGLLRATLPTNMEIDYVLSTTSSMVMGNQAQLHQVLMNLGTNAEFAMRDTGGTLRIVLDDVVVGAEKNIDTFDLSPGSYLRLTCSDTGHGIAQENMARIFEPFYTTKGVGQGTGMGLAVVHGIITNHGGSIRVESRIGMGSTFTLYLPRLDGPLLTQSDHMPTAPLPHGQGCILFIDDEEALAHMGREILEHLGYETVTRTSSVEALEAFRSAPARFDAVITDQSMPNMTGDKLAMELRQIRPDIPIILCTGFSYTMNAEKAKRIGITTFLMKPVLSHDIAVALKDILENPKA